jgi:hypothetical protein
MIRPARPYLWLLLAAGLFMRAVLPQGYMPERSDGGSIAVVVCGSDGIHLIPLKDETDPDEDRQKAEPPCAFAGLAALAFPPASPHTAAPARVAVGFAEASAQTRLAPSPRLLPPATGPPFAA